MTSDKHKWTDYFRSTTHAGLDLGKLYLRCLPGDRKATINKEYWAQNIISSIQLAPKPYLKFHFPYRLFPSLILEEKIDFHEVYKKSDKSIVEIAKALRQVHNFARNKRELTNNHIGEDKLLSRGVYDPLTILKVIISDPFKKLKNTKSHLVTTNVENTLAEIEKRIVMLHKKVKYKKEYCSLIHGDLNETNILRTKRGKIVIIDWADCRWDIVSCDLSQFIYLHLLSKREQKLLLKTYNVPWITQEMLEIHRLLLVGWDIIYLITVDLDYEPNMANRLKPLKEKVWNKEVTPL